MVGTDAAAVAAALTPGSAGIKRCVAAAWLFKLTWTVSCSRSQSHTLKRRSLHLRVSTRSETAYTHSYLQNFHPSSAHLDGVGEAEPL